MAILTAPLDDAILQGDQGTTPERVKQQRDAKGISTVAKEFRIQQGFLISNEPFPGRVQQKKDI